MRPAANVDHYRRLGVPRSADAAEIRAAYLALIKQYHPDTNQDRGSEDEEQAAAVNLAYTVLRDPEARARHDEALRIADAEVAAQRLRLRVLATGGAVYTPPPPAPSRGRRIARRIFWLLLILIVAASAAVFMEIDPPRLPQLLSAPRTIPPAGEERPRRRPPPPISDAAVTDAVDDLLFIATNGNSADAVRYSGYCYEELEARPSLPLADKCIGFDLAAGNWLVEKERGHETSWFAAAETEPRHDRALRLLLPDAQAARRRLDSLGRMAVSRIARHLAPPSLPAERIVAENAQNSNAAGLSF